MAAPCFSFSVSSVGVDSAEAWKDAARAAEDLGYDALLLTDHLDQPLAPFSALAAAASVTQRINVGTYVLNNDLRHPLVTAKELGTLDMMSNGRAMLGIGSGWLASDYDQSGLARSPGGTRVERLAEAVRIIRDVLAEGRCHLDGRHYRIAVDDFQPRTARVPAMLIGGGGRKLLEMAGATADIVSLAPRSTPSGGMDEADAMPEAYDEKIVWVRAGAAGRGRPPRIDCLVWECFVSPSPQSVVDVFATSMGCPPARVLEIPSMLIGSVDGLVEILLQRHERWGLDHVTVPLESMEAFAPVVRRLARR